MRAYIWIDTTFNYSVKAVCNFVGCNKYKNIFTLVAQFTVQANGKITTFAVVIAKIDLWSRNA